jgi:uncharacterized protein
LRRRAAAGMGGSSSWALVTGASSGLGREFVRAIAADGQPVLAVARRGDRLQALSDEMRAMGFRVEPLVADLATGTGIAAVVGAAAQYRIDLLVNNAGVAAYGPFSETPFDRLEELLRVDVDALVRLTHELLPPMIERSRGGVINIASQMAFQPMPYFAAYAASKAFVLNFSEAIAAELRGTGVRVTVIAPGFVRTELGERAGSRHAERHFPHLDAERVVASSLRAHRRGRTVKVAGGTYMFLTAAGRFAPRAAMRRGLELVLRPSRD